MSPPPPDKFYHPPPWHQPAGQGAASIKELPWVCSALVGSSCFLPAAIALCCVTDTSSPRYLIPVHPVGPESFFVWADTDTSRPKDKGYNRSPAAAWLVQNLYYRLCVLLPFHTAFSCPASRTGDLHCREHAATAESGVPSGADWGLQALGNSSGCHEENSVFGYYSQTTVTCCKGHYAPKPGGAEWADLLQRAGCLGNVTLCRENAWHSSQREKKG